MLVEESLEIPLAVTLVPGKDAKKSLRAYLLQESLLKIKKEERQHLKRVVGQAKEENSPGGQAVEFLRQVFLHNPRGH